MLNKTELLRKYRKLRNTANEYAENSYDYDNKMYHMGEFNAYDYFVNELEDSRYPIENRLSSVIKNIKDDYEYNESRYFKLAEKNDSDAEEHLGYANACFEILQDLKDKTAIKVVNSLKAYKTKTTARKCARKTGIAQLKNAYKKML